MMSMNVSRSRNDTISFEIPTIGPKAYVAKGPSGWPETFRREQADKELVAFLLPAAVDDVIDVFVMERELIVLSGDEKKPIDWFTITGFLGRTMSVSPLAVPHAVGVAFWARALLTFHARKAN